MKWLRKKTKEKTPALSTASLPDIIFILLFFFMVVTVVRSANLLVHIRLPHATELTKLQRKSMIEYIYIGAPKMPEIYGTAPRLQLNDRFAQITDIAAFVAGATEARFEEERNGIVYDLKVDKDSKMGLVSEVKQELRKNNALNICYAALPGEDGQP